MVVLLLRVGAPGIVRVLLSRCLCWRVVGGVVMAVVVLLGIGHGVGSVACQCCWHGCLVVAWVLEGMLPVRRLY